MLAAIVKVTGIMSDEAFLEDMKGSFKHKFAKKPEVIEGNMKALELALKEVTKMTGEVLDQYGLKKNVNNVDYVLQYVQKIQYQ